MNEVLEVALLYADVLCQTGGTHVQTGSVHCLHVYVVAVDVPVEVALTTVVIVYLIEEVAVKVCPLLKGILLAEYAGGDVAGYEGRLDEQGAAATHGVDEVALTMPAGHHNHAGGQHLVQRGLGTLLTVTATVERLARGVE